MALGVVVLGLATGTCEIKLNGGGASDKTVLVLNSAKLEGVIADELAAKRRLQVMVACPKDRPLKPGDTFTCEATTGDGASIPIDVVQKDDQGNVDFSVHGVLVDTSKDLAEIKAKLPASAVITCPKRTLHLKQVGDTASCDVRDGDERARLVIRFKDAETSRITMEVVQPDS